MTSLLRADVMIRFYTRAGPGAALGDLPRPCHELSDAAAGQRWLAAHGRPASNSEWRVLLKVRSALQDVVRGDRAADSLAPFVSGVRREASLVGAGVTWTLHLPEGRSAAALAVLTWNALQVPSPGRLRPCANPDCRRFLIDHSQPNSARWCSTAICGNRVKARRHYQHHRQTPEDSRS